MISQKSDLSSSYNLTRIVVIRYLGFIYFVAFLISLNQNSGLLGSNGLLPAHLHISFLARRLGNISNLSKFLQVPTLLWFCDYNNPVDVDQYLSVFALIGIVISSFVLLTGRANSILMFVLWITYHSIVNVGQRWFSFGWESQLLETGFLAIFFVPFVSLKKFPKNCPPSKVVIWGYRWLIFRIMIGAGLIKIRGDQCWRDLTCMNYHYETQPVPNPIAFYLHKSPEIIHKVETLGNHFLELVAPLFMIVPVRSCRIFAGIVQIIFQVILIISGNLSFLNWLTILPSICFLDDLFLSSLFSDKALKDLYESQKPVLFNRYKRVISKIYNVAQLCLLMLIGYLSIPIVSNLLSSRQLMNSSFDNFRLVNTYGAFGSVTKERTEVIVQGTLSDNPNSQKAEWLEYEFNCKPGRLNRRPCLISPYHYRLDWLMWFAAFQNYQQNPWLVHLAAKFLMNDTEVLALIAENPFPEQPPKYIRMQHYLYSYAQNGNREGNWWTRKLIGEYMPVVSLKELEPILKRQNWPTNPKTPAEKTIYKKKKTKTEL